MPDEKVTNQRRTYRRRVLISDELKGLTNSSLGPDVIGFAGRLAAVNDVETFEVMS